jgi:hypothetical protein
VKYGNQYDTAAMFVPILTLMLLGVTLTSLMRRIESWIAPWKELQGDGPAAGKPHRGSRAKVAPRSTDPVDAIGGHARSHKFLYPATAFGLDPRRSLPSNAIEAGSVCSCLRHGRA